MNHDAHVKDWNHGFTILAGNRGFQFNPEFTAWYIWELFTQKTEAPENNSFSNNSR